jgi:hypothetical protein
VQLENPRQIAFLSSFEICCCVRSAARAAAVTRKTHYGWLQHDPAYVIAFEAARRVAADLLESEAIQRATTGWLVPVYYQGRQCGSVRRYSDGLMMFILRGLMPEKYGNKKPQIPATASAPVQHRINVVYVNRIAARLNDEHIPT